MDPHPLYRTAEPQSRSRQPAQALGNPQSRSSSSRGHLSSGLRRSGSVGSYGVRRDGGRLTSTQVSIRSSHPSRWEPLDLRILDYVVEPDPNLTCAICRTAYVDPVILDDCDHCFCTECLELAWNVPHASLQASKGSCPTCRVRTRTSGRDAISRILTNMLDDLIVKCPQHDAGCMQHIRRGEIHDHINNYCDWTYVDCPDSDCRLPVRRHRASDCIHVQASCLSCKQEMHKGLLDLHWRKECPDHDIACHLCGGLLPSRTLASHMTESCPVLVIGCPGVALGCTFRSIRRDMPAHDAVCALARLRPYMDAQERRIADMEKESVHTKRKISVLESGFTNLETLLKASGPLLGQSITPIQHEGRGARSSVSRTQYFDHDNNAMQDSDASDLDPHHVRDSTTFQPATNAVTPYTHLLSLHEALRNEVILVSDKLHELEARQSMAMFNETMRLREELALLGGQVGGLSRQVSWLQSTSEDSVRQGVRLARRSTDEGRTKL